MGQTRTHRFLQSAALSLLGSVAIVLLAYVSYRSRLDLLTTASLCLILVVLVSLGGRFIPAAVASIVALLSVNYFFVAPLFSIRIAHPMDEIAGAAFLVTALVISRLIARLRQSFSEVQALNERLQLVVDTIPALVARARPDGASDFINRRWQEYLGLPVRGCEGLGLDRSDPSGGPGAVSGAAAGVSVQRGAGGVGSSRPALRRRVPLDLALRGPLA